jgi:hypothetical protein
MLALVAGPAWYLANGGSSQQHVNRLLRHPPSATMRSVTDGVLRVPVPPGGTGSINRGFQLDRPVAWILVGNFRFPANWGAEHREGTPTIPRDGILVAVGDFILDAYSSDWPSVRRLHLPPSSTAARVVSWNVRFGGRALRLSVRFGSTPREPSRAHVNALLARVHHV